MDHLPPPSPLRPVTPAALQHFMGLFVFATVPLAVVLNALLLLPLPLEFRARAQSVVDATLHFPLRVGPASFSLFHLILLSAAAVYLCKSRRRVDHVDLCATHGGLSCMGGRGLQCQ